MYGYKTPISRNSQNKPNLAGRELLDQFRGKMRSLHYAYRTVQVTTKAPECGLSHKSGRFFESASELSALGTRRGRELFDETKLFDGVKKK